LDYDENITENNHCKSVNKTTLKLQEKPYRKAELCTNACKYQEGKVSGKIEDVVQCHICQHWCHPSCLGENGKDIINIWSCPICRSSTDVIYTIYEMMINMHNENIQQKSELSRKLTEVEKQQSRQNHHMQALKTELSVKSKQLSDAVNEVSSLRAVIADLNSNIASQTWKSFQSKNKQSPTLFVGSSMIRDVSGSQLENTEVVCIPGGCIKDVAKTVSNVSTNKYGRIVLVAGCNDCNPRNPSSKQTPSDIVNHYKSLVELCKQKASSVVVSSVCPRIGAPAVQKCIESVNAGLQVMCAEEEVIFTDNTHTFHLKDDSINDGYFLDDGVHLTYRGTDKLVQNLGLKLKEGISSVCMKKIN
jgi:CRISPR/Cas system CMR subunit Cmr6 (Cas7 group RAMP superfamily)